MLQKTDNTIPRTPDIAPVKMRLTRKLLVSHNWAGDPKTDATATPAAILGMLGSVALKSKDWRHVSSRNICQE